MESVDYLLVGGGIAATRCATTLRRSDSRARILMVTADEYPPYSRPPLSKDLLFDKQRWEQLFLLPDEYYRQNGVELVRATKVDELDADERTAEAGGKRYRYNRALIATGAEPRVLNIEGAGLNNVFYLRSLANALRIKRAMENSSRAVIIGAGFIGMELASAFAQRGIETTMVIREDKLWGKLGSGEISEFFKYLYQKESVRLLFNEQSSRFEGEAGGVKSVVTASGKMIPCDMVCVGIGVTPATGFIQSALIHKDAKGALEVDGYLHTADPQVFAAGDVASYYDPIFDTRWRIEHWHNSFIQGELAARNMLGALIAFDKISYFFSKVFGARYEFLGDNRNVDEIVVGGSFDNKEAIVCYLKKGLLRAGFMLGTAVEERTELERLIKNRMGLDDYRGKYRLGKLGKAA